MAFRVPTYEANIAPAEGVAPSVPMSSAPPPAAFGIGQDEQLERTGETVGRIGETLANHMLERQRQAQEAQVVQADTDFRLNLQKAMFDTTPDDKTGAPKGVFNRQGFQANGATEDFDQQFRQMRQDAIDGLDSPYQKQRLSELTDENYPRIREMVAHHEGTQIRQAQDQVVEGNLGTRIANAPLFQKDPDGLKAEIKDGQQIQYGHLRNNGVMDGNVLAGKGDEFAKKMVVSALGPMMEDDTDAAQTYFDEVKDTLSPKTQDDVQKLIDDSEKVARTRAHKAYLTTTNDAEAQVAGLIANDKLTPADFETNWQGKVSPEFFKLASVAIKNKGTVEATPAQQASKAVQLMQEYSRGMAEGDPSKQTANLMKFRNDVLANSTKLAPDQFAKLLSWTDPNFVNQVQPKKSWLRAGLDFIENHYRNFVPDGTSPATAMMNFVYKATDPGTAEKDIPAAAQAAVKPDVYQANPALMGTSDISNNVGSRAGGVRQIYGGSTDLKPDQRITAPSFKAGDEREHGGLIYVRGENGKWRPKTSPRS